MDAVMFYLLEDIITGHVVIQECLYHCALMDIYNQSGLIL